MADTQAAPQAPAGLQPIPALGGSVTEAQEALLNLLEPEEETPEEEEAQPTEEEESQPEEEDESFEEESEEESEDADEREPEVEDVYAVTVNGEEQTVTLDELVKGYSRQSDYTRKTQELSEQRKGMEQYHNQWNAEIQQIQTERQQYVSALQNVVENSMGALDQFGTVDWESLKNENPLEYITKRDEFRETQERVRQVQFEQQQAHEAYQQESTRNHRRALNEEHGKLAVALPEWSEESSRKKLGTEIKEYALTQGYSQEEIKSLIDHRSLLVLHKAMKFDKASSPDVVQKKVKNKPNVIRTGSPKSKSGVSKSKRTAQMKRLRGTGHIDDASALLEDFIDI
jgi:hypothetical protein